MKVVIVIVSYNPLKWIDKCLKSLQLSSIQLEICIVDNCSTDGSQEIIKTNYPEVDFIQCEKNLGFGAANNIGIKKAYDNQADFVFLLNQDAWVETDTIEELIRAQQKEPDYGIVSPMHLNGDGSALDFNFSNYIIPSACEQLYSDIFVNKIKEKLYEVKFVNAAGWLISKNCLETVGGFNPSFFHYSEDDNYIQRVQYHRLKIGILPTVVLFHDRERRTENFYFSDKKEIYRRSIIYKFSNPFFDDTFEDVYKKLNSIIFKSFFRLNFKSIRESLFKKKILNKLDKKTIMDRRNESKISKPSFLDK